MKKADHSGDIREAVIEAVRQAANLRKADPTRKQQLILETGEEIMRTVKVLRRSWPQGYAKPCTTEEIGVGKFHQWGSNYEEFEGGPGNFTIAIVEMPDGSIITPQPEDIVFINEDIVFLDEDE